MFSLLSLILLNNSVHLRLTKKRGIRKSAILGVIYNLQNPYLGLGNGRQYWGGGGIALGGAVLGGTSVPDKTLSSKFHFVFLMLFAKLVAKLIISNPGKKVNNPLSRRK